MSTCLSLYGSPAGWVPCCWLSLPHSTLPLSPPFHVQGLNDFQRLLGNISSLWPTVKTTNDLIIHLNQTFDGDKDVNSPRKLTAKAEKELTLVEEKLQEAHVDWVNPNLNCILVIVPSRIFPTGILMWRDYIRMDLFTT